MDGVGSVKCRSHDHYAAGEYNPRHDPGFEQRVFTEIIGAEALPVIGAEWQEHIGARLDVSPWSVNDAVDALRARPHRLIIEGDKARGYRVVGVERWRRGK